VPSGRPREIAIPAIGLHTAIGSVISTHAGGRWTIDPPKQTLGQLQRVYWWSEHAAPADPSTGAAYLYGHSCLSLVCAFNDLDQVSKGDQVRVTTSRGVLSYRVVAQPIRLAKTAAGIGSSSIYNYGAANRLVLITCGYLPDGSSPFNWAVIARLATATPAR
jgi:LPXTG-site transpeptidase (sortase) family protein